MPSNFSRYIFFGTRAYFSTHVLECLYRSDLPPVAIIIPEYPGNRKSAIKGLIINQPENINPLEKLANTHNTPCIYSPHEHTDELVGKLSEKTFDYILVACWPFLLSREIRRLASKAALNLHPSLLPHYRGAKPVQEQIENHELNLGVSLHLLDDKFDTGEIVKQVGFYLSQSRYSRYFIENKAAELGAKLFIEAVEQHNVSGWNLIEQ